MGILGIQLSVWVEKIVGKGEIARLEQFFLSPQCFQKQYVVDLLKRVIMEWRVNMYDVWKRNDSIHIIHGESYTILKAYTLYRHLEQYCTHPSI